MSNESEGPLAALLAEHPDQQETVLDVHYKNSIAPKIEQDKNQKAKNENQIIVFDSNSDSDSQIGLSFRQMSFVSIDGNIVSKNGESFSNVRPTKTIPIEDVKEIKEANDEEESSDDENNRQVKIVKELRSKNKNRWKEIGYKSPPDLINMTRAKSMASFSRNNIDEEKSLSSFLGNVQNNNPNGSCHKRCGSDGMELGEASSSLLKMSRALMLKQSTKKPKQEMDDINEEYDNQNDENSLFYGHLGEIISGYDKVIHDAVRTGNLSTIKDPIYVYKQLDKLKNKCVKNFWVDEASYLTELMDGLDVNRNDIKENTEVDLIKKKAQKSKEKYDLKIKNEYNNEKVAIQLLKEEYEYLLFDLEVSHEASRSLYKNQKISKEINKKKEKARQLMRNNQNDKAQKLILAINKLEKQQNKHSSSVSTNQFNIEKDYLNEEFELEAQKIHFKCQSAIQAIINKQKNSQAKYQKQIKNIQKYSITLPKNTYSVKYIPKKNDILSVRLPKLIDRQNERIENFNI